MSGTMLGTASDLPPPFPISSLDGSEVRLGGVRVSNQAADALVLRASLERATVSTVSHSAMGGKGTLVPEYEDSPVRPAPAAAATRPGARDVAGLEWQRHSGDNAAEMSEIDKRISALQSFLDNAKQGKLADGPSAAPAAAAVEVVQEEAAAAAAAAAAGGADASSA